MLSTDYIITQKHLFVYAFVEHLFFFLFICAVLICQILHNLSKRQFISPPIEVGEFLQSVVKTGKYSYKEAVIDELATVSPSEYLTKILIQVF